MSYLELNNIIHRDLAARNILVEVEAGGKLIVKVSFSFILERKRGRKVINNNKMIQITAQRFRIDSSFRE